MTLPLSLDVNHFIHKGYKIAYLTQGPKHGLPIIYIHGIFLDANVNRELAKELANAGYRVIQLDLIGHGLSDKPIDAFVHRTDFYADQVIALMNHLNIDKAVVGGVSLGSITSLQTAARNPERVIALLLEMPVMESSTPFAAILLTALLFATNFAKPLYRLVPCLFKNLPRPNSGWLTSVMNALSQDPSIISAIAHGLMVGPIVPTVDQRQSMNMPTLIIGHGKDYLHNLHDAFALSRQMKNAKLIQAYSILELRLRPKRLTDEILNFLASLPTSPHKVDVNKQPDKTVSTN